MENKEKQNKSILVVEDELNLLQAVAMGLSREGFDVIKAVDGEQGLRFALEKHPNMIITDIKMPKMDGMSMLEKLRTDAWGKDVPVIILTNMDTESNVLQGQKTGVVDFLVKSNTTLEQLFNQVKVRIH